jgi:hypothetical protein
MAWRFRKQICSLRFDLSNFLDRVDVRLLASSEDSIALIGTDQLAAMRRKVAKTVFRNEGERVN